MWSIVSRHDLPPDVVAIPPQASTLAAFQHRAPTLGFPLKVLGHSTASVFPRRVGDWWMEPLNLFSDLPPRASERLDAILSLGLTPKAVVLFHEIVSTDPTPPADRARPEQLARLATVAAAATTRTANWLGPVIGRALVMGAGKTGRTLRVIGAAIKRGPDPCLVVITNDGYWIELDRWYS